MSDIQKVTVTNIDISFLNLVWLLVKFSFAVIPVFIIIGLFVGIITALFPILIPLDGF
jgi:hypothetical protein